MEGRKIQASLWVLQGSSMQARSTVTGACCIMQAIQTLVQTQGGYFRYVIRLCQFGFLTLTVHHCPIWQMVFGSARLFHRKLLRGMEENVIQGIKSKVPLGMWNYLSRSFRSCTFPNCLISVLQDGVCGSEKPKKNYSRSVAFKLLHLTVQWQDVKIVKGHCDAGGGREHIFLQRSY